MAEEPYTAHQTCPKCEHKDCYTVWEDGHSHCNSCGYALRARAPKAPTPLSDIQTYGNVKKLVEKCTEYAAHRGISYETMKKYDVLSYIDHSVEEIFAVNFPYDKTGSKLRFGKKQFTSIGQMRDVPLFGQDKFPAASSKSITITEGEYDALAVFEMFGQKYPAVSPRSSASAEKDCARNFEYLNSFEQIYLAFDNDPAGKKALEAVAKLFNPQKVYHVEMTTHNDPNDYLMAGEYKEFVNLWYNAKNFMPEGITSGITEFCKLLIQNVPTWGLPIPFKTLNDMCYGLHKEKIILFTALEGRGKTEIIRAIEHSLLKHTDATIGCIHLEESKARMLEGLVGYELETPVHLPDMGLERNELTHSLNNLLQQRDDRLHLYSHFDSESPDVILEKIRYLVTVLHCEFVFLDHITACVTGLEDAKQRESLDYLSTKLGHMVEDLQFGLAMVSHVNDNGLTRGSRMPSKVASFHVHMDRDPVHPNEHIRNTTFLTVKKNRFAGLTGDAGQLIFDPKTFMLHEAGFEETIKREAVPYG